MTTEVQINTETGDIIGDVVSPMAQQELEEFAKYRVPPDVKLVLTKMLRDTIQVLDKHKITYWATFGTLLALMRHRGPNPVDDDHDLGVSTEDFCTKIPKVLEELAAMGYNTDSSPQSYTYKVFIPFKILIPDENGVEQLKYTNELRCGNRMIAAPTLDFFPFDFKKGKKKKNGKRKQGKVQLHFRLHREDARFKAAYFELDNFLPLAKIPYKYVNPETKEEISFVVNAPNNTLDYLNRLYRNWQKRIVVSDHHGKLLYSVEIEKIFTKKVEKKVVEQNIETIVAESPRVITENADS